MSLFQCEQCGAAENTALSNYWYRRMERTPLLCSLCDPDIAQWHGHFPYAHAGVAGFYRDTTGCLWHPSTLGRSAPPLKELTPVPLP